jgi:hypothetical protein
VDSMPRIVVRFAPSNLLSLIQLATSCELLAAVKRMGGSMRAILFGSVFATLIAPAFADQTGIADMHSLRREGGRTCMSDHFHSGSSSGQRTKAAAAAEAIRSWADFTALEYGSDWARYGKAASRSMRCKSAADGWSCDLEARPCL